MTPDPGACTEPELTGPVDLCGPDGRLLPEAVGWSRRPLHRCLLPRPWGRRKRWDYWCVTGPGWVLSATYADVDYLGTADVWFHDLDTGDTATAGVLRPLGRGIDLAAELADMDDRLRSRRLDLDLVEQGVGTRLRARADTRQGPLEVDLLVRRPAGHESLSVVIPWTERRFQWTTKDLARPTVGEVRWAGRRYDAVDGEAWGTLDAGRGVWPYRTRWNWGAGAGRVGERVVGLQLGGKWTDGTGMTENALVVDGRLSKLSEELVWDYDPADWLRPWRVRTPVSGRVDLTLRPAYDKVTRLHALVAASRVDQCFGTWHGTVVPDDGPELRVDGLAGWAEEAAWRW